MTGEDERSTPLIVVGVDGSPASIAALRWGMEDAKRRGASVLAIHAWHFPIVGGPPFGAEASTIIDPEVLRESAQFVLEDTLKKAGSVPGVTVEGRTVLGSAARALIEASADADELVVGSRGHGGFAGLLLGSVSLQCAHHAGCPVVIVRPPRSDAASAADASGSAGSGSTTEAA